MKQIKKGIAYFLSMLVLLTSVSTGILGVSEGIELVGVDTTSFANNINVLFCFSTVFANGIKAHSIAKAPVTVSLRERRLQVLFLFR